MTVQTCWVILTEAVFRKEQQEHQQEAKESKWRLMQTKLEKDIPN